MMPAARPQYHDLVRQDVFAAIPAMAGRVLDFGGGVGATSAALKSAGRAAFAAVADQVAGNALPEIDRAFAGDLEDTAFIARVIEEAGPFDTILALDILEHLRDPWSAVAALHKGLAPGGCIVASIPNVNHVSVVVPLVLRGRFDLEDAGLRDRTHLRWFVRSTAIDLMTSSGLQLELVQPNLRRKIHRMVNALTLGAASRFLALQYLVRVRRHG